MMGICSFFRLLIVIGLVGGCASAPVSSTSDSMGAAPRVQVFPEPFENVWKSAQIAMATYPIKINDMDSGVLETDFIKGDSVWLSPNQNRRIQGGTRYKLVVNILKGKLKDKNAVKVTISKNVDFQKDFFSSLEKTPSDGYEEKSVMYRIEREIQIDKALQRVKKN